MASLLATGSALTGGAAWWPGSTPADARSVYWRALAHPRHPSRPPTPRRPALLPEAGLAFLRSNEGTDREIWCRCDHGPLGFLSTAAHGHADALSVEVRVGGVDVLADPGTYRYQGSEEWRRYFRSTRGHNTLELGGTSQSVDGGPFMWLRHATSRLIETSGLDGGDRAVWIAEHDGYDRLDPPAVHRRTVALDRGADRLELTDTVDSGGEHDCILSFHLGPAVECRLAGSTAELRWEAGAGMRRAVLALPTELAWCALRGETNPPAGWYSAGFDAKQPATLLVGAGRLGRGRSVRSSLTFCDLASEPQRDGGDPWI